MLRTFGCSFQDEKEQLAEFKTHLEGLQRRARTLVQLKPRNPASPIKGKQPIQAVCDFKQMEVEPLRLLWSSFLTFSFRLAFGHFVLSATILLF